MAYDRAGTGSWPWLKSVGSQDTPLDRDWRATNHYLLNSCWFSKHPRSLRAGDVFVYYAASWGVFPALMELVSDSVIDDGGGHPVHGQRWRWRMDIRPLITIPMEHAPSLADVGIDPLRVRRQSYILLTKEEYERARDLIAAAAKRDVADAGP